MIDESRVIYRDDCIIVYKKIPGEDSENLIGQPIGRLDKPVGGLMLLSMDTKYQESLKESYKKSYIACVKGIFDEDSMSGEMTDYLLHDRRANKVFPVKKLRKGVREARLKYKVVGICKDTSLVDVSLETGRTHQIRVQFASRKHPLNGDGKYGSRVKGDIALFAYKIEYAHPITNEHMSFTSLPDITNESLNPWKDFEKEIIALQY